MVKLTYVWDKVFKNEPSKICGRQPLKIFTWSILKYCVPFVKVGKYFNVVLGPCDDFLACQSIDRFDSSMVPLIKEDVL